MRGAKPGSAGIGRVSPRARNAHGVAVCGGVAYAADRDSGLRVIDVSSCVACPEDLDNSGDVGFPDLLAVLSAWGPCE